MNLPGRGRGNAGFTEFKSRRAASGAVLMPSLSAASALGPPSINSCSVSGATAPQAERSIRSSPTTTPSFARSLLSNIISFMRLPSLIQLLRQLPRLLSDVLPAAKRRTAIRIVKILIECIGAVSPCGNPARVQGNVGRKDFELNRLVRSS